ncbi:MAG: head GIN domain-containing protein [Bacteroidota bacterium]
MKNIKILLLAFSIASIFSSCELDEICEKGEGPTVEKELDLPPFHSILLDVSADVFITQGEAQSIRVEGQENIIDLLEQEVRNETWEIDFERTCVRNYDGLKIFITLPDVRGIEIDGSGNVTGENVFTTDNIDLDIDGSGDMDLALEVKTIDARIDGSGDMELEGIADKAGYYIRGSGDIRAFDLETLEADVEIRGSGSVETTVLDFLRIDIDGSGDVFYKGNPEIEQRIDGSGDVKDAN